MKTRPTADRSLRDGFVKGLLGAACGILVFVGLIGIANHGHHRPEGVAEHWLDAVSDTTRKGVEVDARKRAAKLGSLDVARPLLPGAGVPGRKSAFTDLEVGKAVKLAADRVGVPFLLHQRVASGKEPTRSGTIVLDRTPGTGSGWRVDGVTLGERVGKVPSQGGPPPSRAPAGLWIGALVAGLAITGICAGLVVWSGRSRPAPVT